MKVFFSTAIISILFGYLLASLRLQPTWAFVTICSLVFALPIGLMMGLIFSKEKASVKHFYKY